MLKISSVSVNHFIFYNKSTIESWSDEFLLRIFWSVNNFYLLCYEVYNKNVTYNSFLSSSHLCSSFFCFIFMMFIHFCGPGSERIKVVLNHSLFYFQTRAIKLPLQLSLNLFFFQLSIIIFLNDQTVVLSVIHSRNQKFYDRNSITTLFLNFKIWKTAIAIKQAFYTITPSHLFRTLKLFC